MRAAKADLPPIPLWGSPALLFTCSVPLPASGVASAKVTDWKRH